MGPGTVQTVLARYPDLPVRQSDVTCLDVTDGCYGAISRSVLGARPEPF